MRQRSAKPKAYFSEATDHARTDEGYGATIERGVVTAEHGELTGERPGSLQRSPQKLDR